MATTPLQPWSSLTLDQKVQYAKNVSMANYGVSQPNTTEVNATNLNNLITATQADIMAIKSLLTSSTLASTGTSAYTTPIPFTSLPPQVQTKLLQFVPPGYSPPTTISGQEVVDIEQNVVNSLQALQTAQSTLPKAGAGTSVQPLQPAAPAVTQPNNTLSTIATVAAVGVGGAALLNVISNKATPTSTDAVVPVTQGDSNYIENFSTAPADEFAGVDQQVANNSYIDQPATVSDEEVQQQLQAFQNETIENYQAANVDAAANVTAQVEAENNQSDNPQDGADQSGFNGATGDERNTQSQATQQDVSNFAAKPDWRVRLSLSPGATYLYKANPPGILAPLQATDGVIFPYTPSISVAYNASYDPTDLTHSNYKFFTYRSSAVDSITIGCDFTAQDTAEAQYLLAVIHFFRSATKMFYGQDQNPKNGTPPPLCYLSGLGAFQFDAHPLAITGFTYTLPTDVDYIKAGSTATPGGVNRGNSPMQGKPGESIMAQASAARMSSSRINPGAVTAPPDWQTETGTKEPTYVPTKINLTITAIPIVTRNDISNKFSLKDYATGALLRGTRRAGGGIW